MKNLIFLIVIFFLTSCVKEENTPKVCVIVNTVSTEWFDSMQVQIPGTQVGQTDKGFYIRYFKSECLMMTLEEIHDINANKNNTMWNKTEAILNKDCNC